LESSFVCSNCQKPIRPTDRFCGNCREPLFETEDSPVQNVIPESPLSSPDTAPIRLEIRIGGQLQQGAHGILDFRIANQTREAIRDVDLEIESSLTIHDGDDFQFDAPADEDVQLRSTFVASLHGQHDFSFRIRIDSENVYQARFPFQVASPSASTQIINFTDARKIEGRVVVGTEGAQLSVSDESLSEPVQSGAFVEVFLRPQQQITRGSLKRPLRGFDGKSYLSDRLLLQVHQGDDSINIGLLAKTSVELGRRRGNDIVTRVYPPSEENDVLTGLISSNHAKITFTANGAELQDYSTHGTKAAGHELSDDSALLSQGAEIRLADVLSLGCELFYDEVTDTLSALKPFAERYVGTVLSDPAGPLRAVRLRRIDNLQKAEEYLVFQHAVRVGSGADCEVRISDPSVSPVHAQILWLGNSMWLEPLQSKRPTLADGQEIPRDQLAPLRPNLPLQFGDVEVTVSSFRQRYLDM